MKSLVRALVAAVSLLTIFAAPSLALEKRTARYSDGGRPEWRGSSSCPIVYYNFCTGWVWIWSGWQPGDRFGVSFDTCCPGGHSSSVGQTFVYFGTGAPSGYGFTGSLDVYDADGNGCPTGVSLATAPFLPLGPQWNPYDFGGVAVPDSTFAIVITMGVALSNPSAVESDHPAAGPTGPAACGNCYAPSRTNHSFYWGTNSTPLCPGSTFSDGVCNAQLLMDTTALCSITAIEPTTWGAVKALYR